ncbi:hypothetical protein DZK27_08795 [Rhodobacteraceae bacterium 63075]|nr:hypothetical protein DZK27_08795 [Rhodobacteraceae bacterium 63075]
MKHASGAFARPFSNMQWYLADAQNTVHCILASPHEMTEDAFRELLARFAQNGPSVLWQEDRDAQTLVHRGDLDLVELGRYTRSDGALMPHSELAETLAKPFTPDEPASFRATCYTAPEPNENGMRTWIVFETSHAMTEGSDISKLLRRMTDDTDARPQKVSSRMRAGEVGALFLVPFIWVLHMFAAWSHKPHRRDYGFSRVTLDKADLGRAARELGVSKRAVIFGTVTHALLSDKLGKKGHLAYTQLPGERLRLDSENYLNVQVDEVRAPIREDLKTQITELHETLAPRAGASHFVSIWHNKLLSMHRFFYRRMPWLYPKNFFDFSPYDLLLSLLPPIRPARSWADLQDTTVFAGSNTGAYPTCIIAVGETEISLNFWLDAAREDRLADVLSNAEALSIGARGW